MTLPCDAEIDIDDPRVIHRTRARWGFVFPADELFYVFLRDPGGRYGWTFGYNSKARAVRHARHYDRLMRAAEREAHELSKDVNQIDAFILRWEQP